MTKPTESMSALVDAWLVEGISWEKLQQKAKAEAEKRGIKDFTTLGALRRHIRRRRDVSGWTIEETEVGVRMLDRPAPKPKAEKPQPKAKTPAEKREAKLPPIVKRKNGKATGKKVEKTTENGRQQVVEPKAA